MYSVENVIERDRRYTNPYVPKQVYTIVAEACYIASRKATSNNNRYILGRACIHDSWQQYNRKLSL